MNQHLFNVAVVMFIVVQTVINIVLLTRLATIKK